MIRFWKRHSLSIVLSAIFFTMIISSWWLGRTMWDQKGDYFTFWLAQTVFSLEADVGGAILLVLFTKWFKEYKSAASNDTMEELAEKVADEMDERKQPK